MRSIENLHGIELRKARHGTFSGRVSRRNGERTPARPGSRARASIGYGRGQRHRDTRVHQADDACIGKGASARARLPPRSRWTSNRRPPERGRPSRRSRIGGEGAAPPALLPSMRQHSRRRATRSVPRCSRRLVASVSQIERHTTEPDEEEERAGASGSPASAKCVLGSRRRDLGDWPSGGVMPMFRAGLRRARRDPGLLGITQDSA
jgi:hypothetical protein